MYEALAYIHTQYILTGVGGGALHVLYDRKTTTREVARYLLASALLANFITPLVLSMVPSIPLENGGAVGFILGYGVFRFCGFADRYIDNRLKPFEGPEHD